MINRGRRVEKAETKNKSDATLRVQQQQATQNVSNMSTVNIYTLNPLSGIKLKGKLYI